MVDFLLRALAGATLGLALVLMLRRPARRLFGAGPAFTLWLLPVVLMLAPLLPRGALPATVWVLPAVLVTPHSALAASGMSHAGDTHASWWIAAWLAGVANGLLRLIVHYVRLRRAARPATSELQRVVRQAAPDVDPRSLRVHAAGPAVLFALPRALLLLPADFGRRFDDQATRELVLRHEITHAHRGDAWWSLALEIATALLWFHPLVWFARPRFRLDQELACDAASLRALPQRSASYARALLDSVAVQPMPALLPWLAEPQLKERITMLARNPPGALRRHAGSCLVAAMLAGGIVVAAGTAPLRAATPSSPASVAPSVDISAKNRNPPRYPVAAINGHQQGVVVLDVTVDAAGNAVAVKVDPARTTAAPVLQTAAISAATGWRFNPGRKNGHAVGGVVRIPVTFSLQDYPSGVTPPPCASGFRYKAGPDHSYSCVAPGAKS